MKIGRSIKTIASALICFVGLDAATAWAEGDYLFDILQTPAFHTAYVKMLAGATRLPGWLGEITGQNNYVAATETDTSIGQRNYRLFHACEAHNCSGHELEVMFADDGSQAYGLLIDGKQKPRFFGHPDAAEQQALQQAMHQ